MTRQDINQTFLRTATKSACEGIPRWVTSIKIDAAVAPGFADVTAFGAVELTQNYSVGIIAYVVGRHVRDRLAEGSGGSAMPVAIVEVIGCLLSPRVIAHRVVEADRRFG